MGINSIKDIDKLLNLDPGALQNLSPELISRLSDLVFVVKAAGIVFIIYTIVLIAGWIMSFLRNRRIKKIYQKVKEIDEKLDILIKDKNKKDRDKKDRDKKEKDKK